MKELDMRGKQCPMPVIEAKKAIGSAAAGEIISVRVDNEIAVENLKKLAKSMGTEGEVLKRGAQDFAVRIQGGGQTNILSKESISLKVLAQELPISDTVVAIASDRMGDPEIELGRILLKGFIYAVSRLEVLPKTVIFYNGGASLTTEKSDSLEDLELLESQGVEILTCGTCLKHLGLENSLKVGTVSNMYDIVDRMASAGKLIRP